MLWRVVFNTEILDTIVEINYASLHLLWSPVWQIPLKVVTIFCIDIFRALCILKQFGYEVLY